jgi:hypothetical protein
MQNARDRRVANLTRYRADEAVGFYCPCDKYLVIGIIPEIISLQNNAQTACDALAELHGIMNELGENRSAPVSRDQAVQCVLSRRILLLLLSTSRHWNAIVPQPPL